MRSLFALAIILLSVAPAPACLWDYDTLRMERHAFPGALELIVGKFLRHSDAFYQWRIEDRSAMIEANDAGKIKLGQKELAAAYDDWAVALDKLGRHEDAIEVINKKAERLNIGQYQTYANRGSFLIHAGQLKKGLRELRKALEINPNAHFGREEYQILLVEYVLEKRGDDQQVSLPLSDAVRFAQTRGGPFAQWLLEQQGLGESRDKEAIAAELARARKGVMGMMRFGNYESPILLEALGDLLAGPAGDAQGQRLAARAYLRAAENVESDATRQAYREMARTVLNSQMAGGKKGDQNYLSLAQLEDQLAREMKETREWFSGVVADEKLWVAKSTDPNPDERFWQKYGQQPIVVGDVQLPPAHYAKKGLPWQIQVALVAVGLTMIGVVLGLLAWRRRRPTGYDESGN